MNEPPLPPTDVLAASLVAGARIELDLTPKPGLVDRRDNGSHPDLSYELMQRSIALLPRYYDELLAHAGENDGSLAACVAAGRRAEERMFAEIASNAHRGYIFLSGLVLLAAGTRPATIAELRARIASLARRIIDDGLREAPEASRGGVDATAASALPGARVRQRLGLQGIHGEALAGLPSVFDHSLPALDSAFARFGSAEIAGHYAMATLMTTVEDTTAVHRCGKEGLVRLREDGARLRAAIDSGTDYAAWLAETNDAYRAMRLTMGGVADCLALTIGLRLSRLQNLKPTEIGT